MSSVVTLPYLGTRSYLHGTTVFETLAPDLVGASDITLRLPQLISSDRVLIEAIDPDDPKKGHAFAIWRSDQGWMGRRLTALPPSAEPARAPYDEQAIIRCASVSDTRVWFHTRPQTTFLKAAIVANKALLTGYLKPPQDGGQWLFTQLELESLPPADASFELRYRSRFSLAAVKTEILFANGARGAIQFAWRTVRR